MRDRIERRRGRQHEVQRVVAADPATLRAPEVDVLEPLGQGRHGRVVARLGAT
jgi:hypothetical protein